MLEITNEMKNARAERIAKIEKYYDQSRGGLNNGETHNGGGKLLSKCY